MSLVERAVFEGLDIVEPPAFARGFQATEITYLLKEVHPSKEARSLAIGGLKFSRGMAAAYAHVIWAESHINARGGLELWSIRSRQQSTRAYKPVVSDKSKGIVKAPRGLDVVKEGQARSLERFDPELWDLYIKVKNGLMKKMIAGAATSKHGMIAAQKIIDAINKTGSTVTINKDSRPMAESVSAGIGGR